MMYKLLGDYPENDIEFVEDQLDMVLDSFPFSIAYTLEKYLDCIEEESYMRAFRRYIDFFELSIQFSSGLFLSQLSNKLDDFDDGLIKLSGRIAQKALSTGDWINDIFIVLLQKMHEYIPEDELAESLYEVMKQGKGNILQGWPNKKGNRFYGMAFLRNHYYGHDTSLSEKIYRELLKETEPRLIEFINALEPVSAYSAFCLDKIVDEKAEQKNYTLIPLKGSQAGRPVKALSSFSLKDHAYYLFKGNLGRRNIFDAKSVLELSPLVVYMRSPDQEEEEDRYEYVFQSINQKNLKKLNYISAHEDARRHETELFKDDFLSFLKHIITNLEVEKGFKIRISEGRSWGEYSESARIHSRRFLGQMKRSKYDAGLYIPRDEADRLLLEFMDNDEGKNACVLLGKAGSGKTNLMCHLTDKLLEDKRLVISVNSKIFSRLRLEDYLLDIFASGKDKLLNTLRDINEKAVKNNQQVIFIFDALNECLSYKGEHEDSIIKGAVALLADIDHLLVNENYCNFRVVMTCRTYTWNELLQSFQEQLKLDQYYFPDKGDDLFSLGAFSEEELRKAYPLYASKFNLKTTNEDLFSPSYMDVRRRLSDPLMLKLISQNYKESYLPKELDSFESIKVLENSLKLIEKSSYGSKQLYILELFIECLHITGNDSIDMQDLYKAFENKESEYYFLSQQLFEDDTYVYQKAFVLLMDAGVLRIEKSRYSNELRFVFERFHEYMYARHFLKQGITNATEGKLLIPASSYENELQRMASYAVVQGGLRNALLMDYDRCMHEPATIIKLASSSVYGASALLTEALAVLLNDNYEKAYDLISKMLSFQKQQSLPLVNEWQDLELRREQGSKGDEETDKNAVDKLNEQKIKLEKSLDPLIMVRKTAIHSIYEIFRSPVFEYKLFTEETSPYELLWQAMADPIPQVRDTASLYIYYINRYNKTLGESLLKHLSGSILNTNFYELLKKAKREELKQSFVEPASRLSLLISVEALVNENDYELPQRIIQTWKSILKKFTLNHMLIRMLLPFLKFFLRRQATVQAAYVNNGIEYQYFWKMMKAGGDCNGWNMESFSNVIAFLNPEEEGFEDWHNAVWEGICSGDAFSYFLIERLMVAQGWKDWGRIKPLIMRLNEQKDDLQYADYMVMSCLYILFHIIDKSQGLNTEMFSVFSSLTKEWSIKCKGLFYSHNNQKANAGKPYKQYVLNWYAAAWDTHKEELNDNESLCPVFIELIDYSIENNDKELLYYCIENAAVLVSDFGRLQTALKIFQYILSCFKYESQIFAFDAISLKREAYENPFRDFYCRMLGTVKSYYPQETEIFINQQLAVSSFPDMEKFREQLFAYKHSHETIGDLLTHKFGNFIIWGIINDEKIRRFFMDAFAIAPRLNNYFSWFDAIVRHSFRSLFGIRL